jgi:hypothetical protein
MVVGMSSDGASGTAPDRETLLTGLPFGLVPRVFCLKVSYTPGHWDETSHATGRAPVNRIAETA